jgi:hypothetical protein
VTDLARQLALFQVAGTSRSEKEQAALRRRSDRLQAMAPSIQQARLCLQELAAAESPRAVIRIRREFVYNASPVPVAASDRKAPPRQHRPPATRLISSRGVALRIALIALFEAQTRCRTGTYPGNNRPLHSYGRAISWTDLIATDVRPSGEGKFYMSASAKKGRQFRQTLDRLASEQLVILPRAARAGNKHEGFLLLHEGGLRNAGGNKAYHVPRRTEPTFPVPMGLFTNGWIHVLENSELALLLVLAFLQSQNSGKAFTINSAQRILHFGLGRDSYESHRMLQRLGLATVTQDETDRFDVSGKQSGNGNLVPPLAFRYHAEGLYQNGLAKAARCLAAALKSSD